MNPHQRAPVALLVNLCFTLLCFRAVATSPVLVGTWPGTPRGDAFAVVVSGTHAYVAAGGAGLVVVDVSNPSRPVRVGGCDTSGFALEVAVSGPYAYVADGSDGLQVISIANPTAPVRVGGFPSSESSEGVAVMGNHVLVADGSGGGCISST